MIAPSAELPPVPALVAQDECGHRLVGRPRLDLVVGAVPLVALAALEEVGLGALDAGQLRGVDAVLHEALPLLADLERKITILSRFCVMLTSNVQLQSR